MKKNIFYLVYLTILFIITLVVASYETLEGIKVFLDCELLGVVNFAGGIVYFIAIGFFIYEIIRVIKLLIEWK